MRAIELMGEVDAQRGLQIALPLEMRPGKVRVIILTPEPDEDEAGGAWAAGIAEEWKAELGDPREDVYTLEDGEPVHAPR